MSHALVTVFVPADKSLDELLAPFSQDLEVEEHDKPCYRLEWNSDAHDASCHACGGVGTYRSTSNPRGKWDYWTRLGGGNQYIDARYPSLTGVAFKQEGRAWVRLEAVPVTREIQGMTTFAIVTPDEGWIDRADAGLYEYGDGIDRESQEQEWEQRFQRAYAHYSALEGYSVVVCDYHS